MAKNVYHSIIFFFFNRPISVSRFHGLGVNPIFYRLREEILQQIDLELRRTIRAILLS